MDRSIEQDERSPLERPGAPSNASPSPQERRETTIQSQEDRLARLRETIDRLAQDRPSMSELLDRLERADIRAVPSLQKSGRLNGMSYEVNGVRIKGSELGRSYTAAGLQKLKGIQYDPDKDRVRLEHAAQYGRDNPALRRSPQRSGGDSRQREYDALSAQQRSAMWEIGRFRTVLAEDLARIQYGGNRAALRQDLIRLTSMKLVEQRSVVVATHSKTHGRIVKSLAVIVLTKNGKDLLRRYHKNTQSPRQAVYAGLVKPREIAHDAAIYRLYQAEAALIVKEGGRVKRVVLDFELKKRVYSPLAKARNLARTEYTRKQAQVAQDNGLKVVQGKIRFPDLRIEYETANGDASSVDLELATEHYRGEHMGTKDQAGFKIYADSASFPRFGAGGSNGRSRASDEDHIIHIFSF
jgi:hypothetical protein